jgi:hypothetical protein
MHPYKYNSVSLNMITGFNPDYQDVKASRLTLIVTVDFSKYTNIWQGLYDKYKDSGYWTFKSNIHNKYLAILSL